MVDDSLTFHVHFNSSRHQTRMLGKLMTLIGEHLGLDAELCFELEIAVVEAVNNAIIHACGDDPGQQLELEISCRPDDITIILSDQGRCVDRLPEPLQPLTDDAAVEDLPESGFGLYLIHQVMDKVEYCSRLGVNTLIMQKNLAHSNNERPEIA